MNTFIQRHGRSVIGILNGFDRLRLRGTLRNLCYSEGMSRHLFRADVLLKNFKAYAMSVTDKIRRATERVVEAAERPLKYLVSSSISKEQVARKIAEQDGISEGLICVLSCVEPCLSFEVHHHRPSGLLKIRSRQRKCLHYYHYFQDPQLGFMHVRFQTWFPFSMHICLNGREWLSRQLDEAGIGYVRRDNCFTHIEDLGKAQQLMNNQLQMNWKKMLDGLVPLVNPVHSETVHNNPQEYYWSVEESEWASDVMFRSPAVLQKLYPRLISHGMQSFSSRDVMRFLGRKVPAKGGVNGKFAGELVSDMRCRPEGVRIKHRLKQNSIKMYDKAGSVLRVETTINNPKDMKVYRPISDPPRSRRNAKSSGRRKKAWQRLRKGVADIHRRAEISQATNNRYLASLAAVEEKTALGTLTEKLCRPVRWKGQRARALNPLATEDGRLLEAVNRGEFAINGFRNRDLRVLLYGTKSVSKETKRRQSAAVTRKLRLLRAHGLIQKITKTHRYKLSPNGRTAITALLTARAADTSKLADAA
jgi:hypothetical protein